MSEITEKNKLGQIFCRHKNKSWYSKKSLFQSISGERNYLICEDCGKQLDERFLEYEGMGYK